jgi:hypothetical protein
MGKNHHGGKNYLVDKALPAGTEKLPDNKGGAYQVKGDGVQKINQVKGTGIVAQPENILERVAKGPM